MHISRLSVHRLGLAATLVVVLTGLSLGFGAPPARAAGDDQRLSFIKSRATAEIDRRLSRLSKLDAATSGATLLGGNDKAALKTQVQNETAGLTSLKTQIASETDLQSVRIDAQAVLTDYHVYALIVPKVWLVRVADDQQVVEGKLNTLSGKLQTRINQAQNSGKDVSGPQNSLNDMIAKTQAAQKVSGPVEQALLPLQPTDFTNDHTLLTGYRDQLKAAHENNKAAYVDAKSIVQSLKNL